MKNQERAKEILNKLKNKYKAVNGTSLKWHKPIDILVASILSAQSTDEQINKITDSLFEKYQTAKDYAEVDRVELERDIKSSGFYHRKADYIQSTASTIVEEYDGKVPDTMDELLKLKGVARKTANIILQNAFNKNVGIAVDTHVMRLSQRLDLTGENNRDKIEKDLMEVFSRNTWRAVNYLFIEHGRAVCEARKPKCGECILKDICPSAFSFEHFKEKC